MHRLRLVELAQRLHYKSNLGLAARIMEGNLNANNPIYLSSERARGWVVSFSFFFVRICFGFNRFRLSELRSCTCSEPANLKEVTALLLANSSSQSCRAKFTLKFTLKSHNHQKPHRCCQGFLAPANNASCLGMPNTASSSYEFPKRRDHRVTLDSCVSLAAANLISKLHMASHPDRLSPLLKPSARRLRKLPYQYKMINPPRYGSSSAGHARYLMDFAR